MKFAFSACRWSFALAPILACCTAATSVGQATDAGNDVTTRWPQWRGAHLDSISSATGLPLEFSPDKNMLWRYGLPGPGGASPVVWDDRVYVTSVDSEDRIWLLCVSDQGAELWRRQMMGKNRPARDGGNSASPSPATDGDRVYAMSTAGFIECFDRNGQPLWSVDLQERYGEFNIQFGMTSTAILDQGRLYLQLIHGDMRDRNATSVGTIVALDAETGGEIWRHIRKTGATAENQHSYASPIIIHDADTDILVSHGGDYVMGHSLDDGTELWRCGTLNAPDNYNPFLRFVASPDYSAGQLIVPSAKNGPVYSLKVAGLSGDVSDQPQAFNWRIEKGTPDVATPLLVNGLVYLARENGILTCLDARSGEEVYSRRLMADRHRSTPVVAENRLYIAGRDGTVWVVSADREGEILARNELGEETLASPAIVNGRVYIRTMDALYCFGDGA
jgi:outer membrane protein assembly factor BamB